MKRLRPARIIISAAVTSVIAFSFFDFHEIIPLSLREAFLFIQPGPSFINFINGPAAAASGFIIIIALTIICGRIFCSFLCPLGTLQDAASGMNRKRKYAFSAPWRKVHYTILAAAGVTIAFSGTVLFQWIEPFSFFGRFAGHVMAPAAVQINNFTGKFLASMDIYSLPVINFKSVSYFAFTVAAVPVIALSFISIGYGRLYCNTICPVGAVLSIAAKFSFFKIGINRDKCISCGKCEYACKSSCIDYRNHHVDFSRCVACFNCIDRCPNGSISFAKNIPINKVEPSHEESTTSFSLLTPEISRGKFLAGLILFPSGVILAGESSPLLYYKDEKSQVKFTRKDIATAPGSIDRERFNSSCTACSLCISVCPTRVLQPAVMQYGLSGITQPFMDYSSGYCNYDCIKCGQACPTGAIKPLTVKTKRVTKIGEVQFIKENCITYTDGIVCGACSEHCPTKAVFMIPFKDDLVIPDTDPAICIGCGACEYVCPVRPVRAIYVHGIRKHVIAELPADEKQKVIIEDDFPF